MNKTIRVVIAIQARKASKRLPEKSIKKLVGSQTIIDSLIQNCESCVKHVSKKTALYHVSCDIAILVPENEFEFWHGYLHAKNVSVISGSMTNVLDRYLKLSGYDYIVRLTADCPNIPPMVINKAIFTAIHHNMDYLSNAWENMRTSCDGHDIEVISSRALELLESAAIDDYGREHVTPFLRGKRMDIKRGVLLNKEDMSSYKFSIDTADEYCAAVRRFETAASKKKEAVERGLYVFDY